MVAPRVCGRLEFDLCHKYILYLYLYLYWSSVPASSAINATRVSACVLPDCCPARTTRRSRWSQDDMSRLKLSLTQLGPGVSLVRPPLMPLPSGKGTSERMRQSMLVWSELGLI